MKKRKNLIWIPVVLVLIGLIAALVPVVKNSTSKDPVYVYRIGDGMIGMSDYYESGGESYGAVTTDRIQTVYLSATQTVTQIKVAEGQPVKKGDVLFTYDTTLSELQLERKSLAIQQMKVNLSNAQAELKTINSYKPIYYRPTTTTTTAATTGDGKISLDVTNRDYVIYSGSGVSINNAKHCWLRAKTMVSDEIIEDLFTGVSANRVYVIFEHSQNDSGTGEITDQFGVLFVRTAQQEEPAPTDPEDPTDPSGETDPSESTEPSENTDNTENAGSAETQLAAQSASSTTYTYQMSFFDPSETTVVVTPPADDGIDWNSGFTSTEIAAMKKEKQEEISNLTFEIKVAEAEYKIMQKEADDGKVTAEFDGVVQNLLDPETAVLLEQPLMKVSGGGGFYITGTVNELELDTIVQGQDVQVVSWDTGESYMGFVSEIGAYPAESEDFYYYSGANVSYYPYKVFVDESANLQDGSYVSLSLISEQTQESGLYLSPAFILEEDGTSYVYVRNGEGLLEKREIVTGRTLWDAYVQIRSGLTADDYVAFPYGRSVKEGASTAEGDWDTLYGE